MRWSYAAVVLSALMISTTAKAGNIPDPNTVNDLIMVLADLAAHNVPKAITDLNQTELDWLIYRAAHPDNPHTPVVKDPLFINTDLALGYLTTLTPATDIPSARAATLSAQTYVMKGPPPYTSNEKKLIAKYCAAFLKNDPSGK